jgi:phosphate transport system substrate-binding protein
MATAQIPDDFRFSITSAGCGLYPIAGATWLLVYEQQKRCGQGKKWWNFKWALTKGESMAKIWTTRHFPDRYVTAC